MYLRIAGLKTILIYLCFFFFLTSAFSQEKPSDFRLRTGVSLRKSIAPSVDARLNWQYRMHDNLRQSERLILEPEFKIGLLNNWDLSFSYRYWIRKRQGEIYSRQRANLSLGYSFRYSEWRFLYTINSQYGIPDLNTESIFAANELVLRNKIRARYLIFGSRWTPEISMELFSQKRLATWLNYQFRTIFKFNYLLNHHSSIDFYYFFENEFNISNALNTHVIGIEYKHRF